MIAIASPDIKPAGDPAVDRLARASGLPPGRHGSERARQHRHARSGRSSASRPPRVAALARHFALRAGRSRRYHFDRAARNRPRRAVDRDPARRVAEFVLDFSPDRPRVRARRFVMRVPVRLPRLALGACLASLLFGSASLQAQTIRSDLWTTNGTVRAAVVLNNRLYIGGDFSYVGPETGNPARIDPVTGQAVAPAPLADGPIYTMLPDGAGGWYVGGN